MKSFSLNITLPNDYIKYLKDFSDKNFGIENSKIIREALFEFLKQKGYSPSNPKLVRTGRPNKEK